MVNTQGHTDTQTHVTHVTLLLSYFGSYTIFSKFGGENMSTAYHYDSGSKVGSMRWILLVVIVVILQITTSDSFQIPSKSNVKSLTQLSCTSNNSNVERLSRREVFMVLGAAGGWLLQSDDGEAQATIMDASMEEVKTFKAGERLEKDVAMERFQKARTDLNYLLEHYDEVVANGGGDNVRRYLGTVGVTSGMYGITKVLKDLQDEADDIVEYTEAMNDFAGYLNAADTSCYSANFVTFSSAKTKPEKFFSDAKSDAIQMQKAMSTMAAQLKQS